MTMILPRTLPSLSLLGLALLLGLAACKPSAPAATDADLAAPPSMDAPREDTKASASEHFAAAADAINPMTSPREAVIASMHKMMDATSYHVSMKMSGGPKAMMGNEVDFVAPDRFRMEMAGVGTQIIVGDTMYMSTQGRSMKVPMPKNTTSKWRDPGNFKEAEASMTAEGMGSESVEGISTQKYNVRQSVPKASDYTLWIAPDGMPLQMRMNMDSKGTPMTMTMRYSRINDPTLSIDAPK
ncbi:hypothetical protein [Thermomonas sp.]|uniref:LolA family protein n=1 Tax=Thermomonas sp. TaxID=1971895 RepID=UPI002487AFA5|nr:hypothetical protein [Thermomonas sp.]MDI1254000.1 hypothetical protein [Thermomonas sp.]